MSDAPFSGRTVRWLVAIVSVSFLGALALSVFAEDIERIPTTGTDSFSKAALGHKAFVEVLRELDIPVVSSRHASARKVSGDAVLVVAEPHDCPPHSPRAAALGEMLGAAGRTLLVLPKWRGTQHRTEQGWVEKIVPIDSDEVSHVLAAAGVDASFVRTKRVPPEQWQADALGYAPSFPLDLIQLLDEGDYRPLVSCAQGVLVAEVAGSGGRLLVLSDPDILANAGLKHGANAPLAVALIETLRPTGGAVVIDETIHGFERVPSLWRELFSFPLVVLMGQAILVLLVLLWAGTGRFGSPERPPPALEPGHGFLVENTAELLRYRGQIQTVLPRYLENAIQGARKALRAPADLEGRALESWLDRIAENRGVESRIETLRLQARTSAASPQRGSRVLDTALRIHRWNEEILHGPSHGTKHS